MLKQSNFEYRKMHKQFKNSSQFVSTKSLNLLTSKKLLWQHQNLSEFLAPKVQKNIGTYSTTIFSEVRLFIRFMYLPMLPISDPIHGKSVGKLEGLLPQQLPRQNIRKRRVSHFYHIEG